MNVVAGLLLISTATSSALPLKCRQDAWMPGYAENEPVVLLDGLIIRSEPGETLQEVMAGRFLVDPGAGTDDIHSIEITCWRPGEDTFGPGPGIPLIRIHTKSALARTRAPVEALVAAQKTMVQSSGRHARSMDELFVHGLPADADVTYSASDLVWSAVAPSEPGAFRCSASSLTGEAGSGEAGSGEPEIHCEKDEAPSIASLQELYDSGSGGAPDGGSGERSGPARRRPAQPGSPSVAPSRQPAGPNRPAARSHTIRPPTTV